MNSSSAGTTPRRKNWLRRTAATAMAVALVGVGVSAAQADVGTMVAHKSPFNCGKRFDANNWSPGHSPSGAIDWQSHGGDAVGGETVRATAGGTARFYSTLAAAEDGDVGIMAYGNYVTITHGDGTKTRYAHLASMVRAPGGSMSVSQGTKLGTVGATGGNYAPHLHYEQITAGGAIDTSPTIQGVTISLGQEKAITSNNAC